jgi:hypothetical protein
MKADKIVPKKPEAVPDVPDTQEDLLAQIGQLLDRVDIKMAGAREHAVSFSAWSSGLLRDEAELCQKLVKRLDKLINPQGLHDLPSSPEVIDAAFQTPPGTVPTWSRPGTFLMWIDYVPCRCVWGGFADPGMEVVAADPRALWLSPAGSVNAHSQIYKNYRTPADLFRDKLTESTTAISYVNTRRRTYNSKGEPAFNLHKLGDLARAAAEAYLAKPEATWLVAALKRGPVDPIPLPAHLQAVQTSLFG